MFSHVVKEIKLMILLQASTFALIVSTILGKSHITISDHSCPFTTGSNLNVYYLSTLCSIF